MKVTIEFYTDNAAFEDDLSCELDAILTKARCKIQRFKEHGVLLKGDLDGRPRQPVDECSVFDTNGNKVGHVRVEETG